MSGNHLAVLGVDLASTRWRNIGSALVIFEQDASHPWSRVTPGAVPWPLESALTPAALADAIDEFARQNQATAVSLDGPQGWRDPGASSAQGVGRACEQSARTPGKTGLRGRTYPGNQVGWISFSIEVFDLLLSREHVHLVNDPEGVSLPLLPADEYYLLECFPTVTWRSSGLPSLPAKSKRPSTAAFLEDLAARWKLPAMSAPDHDNLQAVVAALPAAALLGVGQPISHGLPARFVSTGEGASQYLVEGIIWDAQPAPS